jgi:glycosyltransferase involved in cell wall biosynthesis
MHMGGAETLVMNIFRHIDRRAAQFDFAVSAAGPCHFDEEIRSLGGRIFRHPAPRSDIRGFHSAFDRILGAEGPFAAVHSHVHMFSGDVLRLARRASVPVRIAHSHTTNDGTGNSPWRTAYRWLARRMIRRYATHLMYNSRASGERLHGHDAPPGVEIRLLPNALDLNLYSVPPDRCAFRRQIGLPDNACVITHVGRFVSPKNHIFAVEIFREVLKRRGGAHLVFVGDGPLRAAVFEHTRRYLAAGNIHFLGVRTDVPSILSASDAFLFPSLYEGLGNVVIEAQAAGLHCVVSDAIPTEANLGLGLIHSVGLHLTPGKWADIVCGVSALCRPPWPQRRAALEENGYDIRSVAANLENVYLSGICRLP